MFCPSGRVRLQVLVEPVDHPVEVLQPVGVYPRRAVDKGRTLTSQAIPAQYRISHERLTHTAHMCYDLPMPRSARPSAARPSPTGAVSLNVSLVSLNVSLMSLNVAVMAQSSRPSQSRMSLNVSECHVPATVREWTRPVTLGVRPRSPSGARRTTRLPSRSTPACRCVSPAVGGPENAPGVLRPRISAPRR